MPWRHLRSSVVALVVAALTTMTLSLVSTPGAHAHDYLVGSTPEQDSTVTTPPSEVVLEFNTSISQQFAQVAVVDQDGSTYQSGDPVVDGPTVTQAVDGLPDSGTITISYRIVSSDGHPIGGTVPFTITAGGGAGADEQTSTPDTTVSTGASSSDQDGINPLVWVAAGALALALAAGALALSRRRSRASVDV